ncbi:aspartate/glutamate racemase family protein [Brevibacterium oceani]|uniref:aspartate/glutamate racemase family protein n=1 Tax=Brevibacterium oceani TaxID=358099 RepID=UPI001B340D90|nr:aspartate/glutamate racemase family protein [Brevibacterium oceani]
MTRLAFIHTGAVVIPEFERLAAEYLPEASIQHLLDSTIVSDLRSGSAPEDIRTRLTHLAATAKAAGAQSVMFTCSSISGFATEVAAEAAIEVLRVDETMADDAVATASRAVVVATLPTTLAPTVALLNERASASAREVEIVEALVDGAFDAVASGDKTTHDRLVGEEIVKQASNADVIVLAQASMASAASAVSVDVPVLTSPERGVQRLAESLLPAEI